MTFKEFLWQIGLWKKCPRCGSELWKVGYPNDGFQNYKCSNDECDFGKENI